MVAAGQQNQELLSSITPYSIVCTDLSLQPSRYGAKHFITYQVSPGVIDPFEVIDVRQQDAHGAAVSARAAQVAFEQLDDRATIPNRCERVVTGFEAQALARLHQAAFQFQHAQADAQARSQFLWMERLGQVIVRARFQSLHQVPHFVIGSKKHDVNVILPPSSPPPPAHFQSLYSPTPPI